MSEDQANGVIRPVRFVPTQDLKDTRAWHERYRSQLVVATLFVVIATFLWFIFTAKSVRIVTTPEAADVTVSGGPAFTIGGVHVLREGEYHIAARAEGYRDLEDKLVVGPERNQSFDFVLEKLPGLISFVSEPAGARVSIDGAERAMTPATSVEVAAGEHTILIAHPRYQPWSAPLVVEGRSTVQEVRATLIPNWASVRIESQPVGASISVDGAAFGQTPAAVDILAGTHRVHVKLAGHKAWEREIDVVAQQPVELPLIRLEPADGLVTVVTSPAKAGVTVDGAYRGESPLELRLQPGRRYQVRVFKPGFEAAARALTVVSNREERMDLTLRALVGKVIVAATPADASLSVDGRESGTANTTLELSAVSHTIEVRKDGYASFSTRITPQPGLTQEVNVKLLTVAEARVAALTPRAKSPGGQEMVLIEPGHFTAGSSRREPGRRANETLREVTLTRLYYLSTKEVTNAEFRRFASAHSSGDFEEQDLNDDRQPVVKVSWTDVAAYCNWLSERAKLTPFYRMEGAKIVGVNARSTGYRLPSEAEWDWAARRGSAGGIAARYAWGADLPPPERFANYADRAASHLVGRVVFGYNDNQIASAPVGTFKADQLGLFDMAGNVAEWTSDYYEIPPETAATDPTGPANGEYRVIRGSSWKHGTVTDLRQAYRDYGTDARDDVGFRIARFAE